MTEPTLPSASPGARPSAAFRATLPRELSDFLIEFSIALHKHAMYPGDHPTLAPAAEAVARRLLGLLSERGQLSLGVARHQLIIEGMATDPKHPVLKELANRLHRHHLGAVQFTQGATPAEVDDVLKILAEDADRGGEPLGLGPLTRLAQWPHIRLYPLTFDRLELVAGEEGDESGGTAGVTGGRTAQLWVGLARAALAGTDVDRPAPPPEPQAFRPDGESPPEEEKPPEDGSVAEPAAVARAIEAHERGTAYDQVIVGYLLQIANELKTASGSGALALKKRMSRLVSALDGDTLKRLLDMGGDLSQRRQFILDASQGMAVDAVLDLVKAASGEGAPISGAMLRMLTKMGHHAERLPMSRRPIAETELRDQISELVRGWALADPNPDSYALALQKMAHASPTLVTAEDAQFTPEPERILKMACEVNAVGEALDRAVDELVGNHRYGAVLDVLERAPAPGAAATRIGARAITPDAVRAVLAASPVDLALLDRLISRLGIAAADPLLDVLAEAESRQARRAILDRLQRFGDELAPKLIVRLADERWYVLRNALFLAAEMPEPPEGLNAAAFRQHPDQRVRREAYRLLFRDPVERTRSLCMALSDPEPGLQRLALAATGEGGCPDPALPLVVTIASDPDQESDVRVGAIRVLAAHGSRMALDALLRLTEIRRRSIFDAMRSTAMPAEFLAALGALAAFPAERRARERLEAASRIRDPVVHKVVAEALKGMR
ncbi:MAG: hypothetical protein ABSB58_07085 [Gemmatimonadales bacterium]